MSASSGSISPPSTRWSEPEANLFRTAPRIPRPQAARKNDFQDQKEEKNMLVVKIWKLWVAL